MINDGDRVLEMRQNTEGGLDKIEHEIATEGTVGSDHKAGAEDYEEEDQEDIARKQAERCRLISGACLTNFKAQSNFSIAAVVLVLIDTSSQGASLRAIWSIAPPL